MWRLNFPRVCALLWVGVCSALGQTCGARVTNDDLNQSWGRRHSVCANGAILWFDSNQDIYLSDGSTPTPTLVQAFDAGEPSLAAVDDVVFGLGTGSVAGELLAGWRRGTDFAWVWRSGEAPRRVIATNPINPGDPMNPEGVAIADGSIFFVMQAFDGGNAVKHVFRVDPGTGVATNLTGNASVPGVTGRVRTSGGHAVWVFEGPVGTYSIQYYDGVIVRTIDQSAGQPTIGRGRAFYPKTVGGVEQIFMYNSALPNPGPTLLAQRSSATRSIVSVLTDGWHVAWMEADAGSGADREILLWGGLALSSPGTRPAFPAVNEEFPFQLAQGQALWSVAGGTAVHVDRGRVTPLCGDGWLANGVVAHRAIPAGEADVEVYRRDLGAPAATPPPPLVVQATSGDGQARVDWDRILGADSYTLYLAEEPGVTPANYASLSGGRRLANLTVPATVACLKNNQRYHLVVTTRDAGVEGGASGEGTVIPRGAWVAANGMATGVVRALAAGGTLVYAASAAQGGSVYRSSDEGASWVPLGGGVAGLDIRALATRDDRVFALTRDGDVWRSLNSGTSWSRTADGNDVGEQNKALAISPTNGNDILAADCDLPAMAAGDSFVIRSSDGGDTWNHIADVVGGEIRAYALAFAADGRIYAGGTGTPNVAVLPVNGSWQNIALPPPNFVYSLAVDPGNAARLYAGTRDNGVYRSTNGGQDWTQVGMGLPAGAAVHALVIDPDDAAVIFAGTAEGLFESIDGGEHWHALHTGLPRGSPGVNALVLTASRTLLAGTDQGVYRLDLSVASTPGDGADGDSDGVVDCEDNCPSAANADQADADGDGVGDRCDPTPGGNGNDNNGNSNGNDNGGHGNDNAASGNDNGGNGNGNDNAGHDSDNGGEGDGNDNAATGNDNGGTANGNGSGDGDSSDDANANDNMGADNNDGLPGSDGDGGDGSADLPPAQDLPPDACGAGACGAGMLTAVPMVLFGFLAMKARRRQTTARFR